MGRARVLADFVGGTTTISGTPTFTGTVSGTGSNIKEQLVMLCDGNNYTVSSGTYTSTSVTTAQTPIATYADVTGSSISYTPPSGTTMVVYEFIFTYAYKDNHAIGHFKFFIDSDEVTYARQSLEAEGNPQWLQSMRYTIPIGGSADTTTGRQATWTTAKTLKMQVRMYGGSNECRLHESKRWDGATSNQIHMPKLIVTSYG